MYLNYGIHYLVNAVTEAEGHPAAVLIPRSRAGRRHPADGKASCPDGRHIDTPALCRGPGNLTRARLASR